MITSQARHNLFQSLAELSIEQRELFDLLLEKQGENLFQLEIPRRGSSDSIPLSYSQERIWMVSQLTPDSAADNVPIAFRITGSLDLQALEKSVSLLIQRNEILRTNCIVSDRQAFQSVMSVFTPCFKVIDLQDLPDEERLSHAVAAGERIARSPFNLEKDVLLRVTVFCLGKEDYIVLFVSHQFAIDGLSFRLLLQEVTLLYKAILSGDLTSASALPVQYADFAIWQRHLLTEPLLSSQVNYWKQQLDKAPSRLALHCPQNPHQHRRSSALEGAWEKFELSAAISDQLRALCRKQGVTSFMAFVALLQIILHRYTQQDDISIGTLISNRSRRETANLIGNFSNNLLLRTVFSNELSFLDVLAKVRETTLQAYQHQDLPFQRLSGSIQTVPQFQVLLLLRDSTTAQNLELPDLQVQDLAIDLGLTRMELSLDLTDDGKQAIVGKLEYKTERFAAETIRQILKNLEALLAGVVANPNQKIAEIKLPEAFPAPIQQGDRASETSQELIASEMGSTEFAAPKTELEVELVAIWSELFEHSHIGIYDNFFDLGGHSLLAVKLFAEIDKRLGKQLPLSVLFQAPTISQLAQVMLNTEELVSWSPLVEIQAGNPEKLPLFCMHGGGFNVLIYRDLALNLGSDQPVYGLQARGLAGDPMIHLRLESMAADYIREIQRIQPEGPYMLAGLSNGGNIALEMAQQLHKQGQKVILLALFDSYGPNSIKLLPPLPRFLSSIKYLTKHMLLPYLRKMRSKQPGAWRAELQKALSLLSRKSAEFKSKGKTQYQQKQLAFFSEVELQRSSPIFAEPDAFHEPNSFEVLLTRLSRSILQRSSWAFLTPSTQLEDMDDGISTTLKDLEALYSKVYQAYNPQPYAGEVTVFKAREVPPGHQVDPQLGWGDIALDGVRIYTIPGNHTSIMQSKLLAKQLKTCIEKAVGAVREGSSLTKNPLNFAARGVSLVGL